MEDAIREWADLRGYRAAWFDGAAVRAAFGRLRRLTEEGVIDPAFEGEFLSWMAKPEVLARAETKTVILLAIPRPAHIVTFEDDGRARDLVLPPTYLRYDPLFAEVLADLRDHTGAGLDLRILKAPLKTLAALTGFARYGKNNITYVDGAGSFVQLAAFASEGRLRGPVAPPEGVPSALDECRSCQACRRACPTGAIADDRFLLHGERCLTGFTESMKGLPREFGRLRTPTLIGCLACQEICPVNRGRLRAERLPFQFSPEETAYLLGERGDGPPAPELAGKILALGCTDLTVSAEGPNPIFRRNLRAALRS